VDTCSAVLGKVCDAGTDAGEPEEILKMGRSPWTTRISRERNIPEEQPIPVAHKEKEALCLSARNTLLQVMHEEAAQPMAQDADLHEKADGVAVSSISSTSWAESGRITEHDKSKGLPTGVSTSKTEQSDSSHESEDVYPNCGTTSTSAQGPPKHVPPLPNLPPLQLSQKSQPEQHVHHSPPLTARHRLDSDHTSSSDDSCEAELGQVTLSQEHYDTMMSCMRAESEARQDLEQQVEVLKSARLDTDRVPTSRVLDSLEQSLGSEETARIKLMECIDCIGDEWDSLLLPSGKACELFLRRAGNTPEQGLHGTRSGSSRRRRTARRRSNKSQSGGNPPEAAS